MTETYIIKYTIFLFFIVLLIGFGAGDLFGGNIAGLEAPEPWEPWDVPTNTSVLTQGALEEGTGGVLEDLVVILINFILYIANLLVGLLGAGIFVAQNLFFFFTLMSVDTGVAWMGTIIFSPAIIIILWALINRGK